jgi:hypothetical protein
VSTFLGLSNQIYEGETDKALLVKAVDKSMYWRLEDHTVVPRRYASNYGHNKAFMAMAAASTSVIKSLLLPRLATKKLLGNEHL